MLIGNKYSGYSKDNIRLYFDPVTIMATATAAETAAVVTAAEIAAAEAAAATLAAETAAAATAAAEAKALADAAALAETATAATTAANAAPAFNPAGIMEIGGATAAPGAAPLTTVAEVNAAAMQAGQPTAQEIYRQAATASNAPGAVTGQGMLPAQPLPNVDLAQYGIKGAEFTQPSVYMPEFDPSAAAMPSGPVPYEPSVYMPEFDPSAAAMPSGPANPMSFDSFGNPVSTFSPAYSSADPTGLAQMALDANAAPPQSSLMKGLNSAMNWAKENKFETAVGAYTGASALGLLDPSKQTFNDKPYDGPLSKYRLSPDFKGSTATPNIYKPTYPTYAAGGIMNAGPVQSMSDQNNAMGYQQAMAATGGQVANFAKGGRTGSLTDSLDYYKSMMDGKTPTAPSDRADVGIFRDSDPDTMYQDALTAAQIRAAKVNKRANLSVPSMKRPIPMGQINLAAPGIKSSNKEDVQGAAGGGLMSLAQGGSINLQGSFDMGGGQGGNQTGNLNNPQQTFGSSNNQQPFTGNNNARSMMPQQGVTFLPDPTLDPKIRQLPTDMESIRQSMMNTRGLSPNVMFAEGGLSSLGGYAAGGNPRLLRGPGDGMSDNIPAMIGKKQPARLADGEFVIPADVVSHLGNGSTEAGAKRLHEMMNKVRRDRTGNSKQGKQIVASKYMPK